MVLAVIQLRDVACNEIRDVDLPAIRADRDRVRLVSGGVGDFEEWHRPRARPAKSPDRMRDRDCRIGALRTLSGIRGL
jgi:hypothetical protein